MSRNHHKIVMRLDSNESNKVVTLDHIDVSVIARIEQWIKTHTTAIEDECGNGTFLFASASEFNEAVKVAIPY